MRELCFPRVFLIYFIPEHVIHATTLLRALASSKLRVTLHSSVPPWSRISQGWLTTWQLRPLGTFPPWKNSSSFHGKLILSTNSGPNRMRASQKEIVGLFIRGHPFKNRQLSTLVCKSFFLHRPFSIPSIISLITSKIYILIIIFLFEEFCRINNYMFNKRSKRYVLSLQLRTISIFRKVYSKYTNINCSDNKFF